MDEVQLNTIQSHQEMVDGLRDGLSVRQNLREVPGAEDVPECGGGQQPRGPVVVVIVTDCAQGVGDLKHGIVECNVSEELIIISLSNVSQLSSSLHFKHVTH